MIKYRELVSNKFVGSLARNELNRAFFGQWRAGVARLADRKGFSALAISVAITGNLVSLASGVVLPYFRDRCAECVAMANPFALPLFLFTILFIWWVAFEWITQRKTFEDDDVVL